MNYYAAVTLLCFVAYIYLGLRELFLNPNGVSNRAYLYLCVAFAVWATGGSLLIVSNSSAEAFFWYRVSSFGFISLPLFGAMLYNSLLGKLSSINNFVLNVVFGSITVCFILISINGSLFTTGFEKNQFGW